MRAAYLVSRYPAVNHTYILREVRQLRALGMDVLVASILPPDRPKEQLGPEEREEAARTFYVRPMGAARIFFEQIAFFCSSPVKGVRGLFLMLRLSRWNLRTALAHLVYGAEAVVVGRWMRRERLAHAHTHFASTTALFLRALFPVTISATIHGPAEFNDPLGFLLPEKARACAFQIAIGNFGLSQLMRFSAPAEWGRMHVARLGIDPASFTPPEERPAGSPLEILFVGQLAPAKGVHVLIEACARLIAEGSSLRLRLVGDGPERRNLEDLAARLGVADHVAFEGALSHHRVSEFYARADIFAMSSFAEGIPVVLMEAMAMELPCVATNVMGIPELIEHEATGLLAPPADSGALAAALLRLARDRALRLRLGRAGREKVLRDYNAAVNGERLHRIFRENLSHIDRQ